MKEPLETFFMLTAAFVIAIAFSLVMYVAVELISGHIRVENGTTCKITETAHTKTTECAPYYYIQYPTERP